MMQRIFQHPGWLKVLAVALAILLWAYVMPTYTAEMTQPFEVPLYVIPHPTYKILTGPANLTSTVRVTATGKRLAVSRLRAEDIKAQVDYSKITVPNVPQTVDVTFTGPQGLKVSYTYIGAPITVTLVEDKNDVYKVSLEPPTGVIAYQGKEYRYRAVAETEQVQIQGRSDFLSRVDRGRISLDPAHLDPTETVVTVPVVPVDANGKVVENLESQQMRVNLTWEELPPSREFKVSPATGGALPPGYVVTNMVVEPSTVRVRAAVLGAKLPTRETLETAPIDLTGKTKSFTTAISLLPPSGVIPEVQTVNVTINIAEATVEKVFKNVPLAVRGDSIGRSASLAVTDVHVTVNGPASVITPLDAGALGVYVDVEGLREGKHSLPVKFTTPPGVVKVTVDPAVVDVTLR